MKPKIVVLCGSSKFVDIMSVCAWLIERNENAITMGLHLLPEWYGAPADHLAESENVAGQMDELHKRKIDLCDEIFVVNHYDYIGESTNNEIQYTVELGKKIRWFTNDDIGFQTKRIIHDYVIKKVKIKNSCKKCGKIFNFDKVIPFGTSEMCCECWDKEHE